MSRFVFFTLHFTIERTRTRQSTINTFNLPMTDHYSLILWLSHIQIGNLLITPQSRRQRSINCFYEELFQLKFIVRISLEWNVRACATNKIFLFECEKYINKSKRLEVDFHWLWVTSPHLNISILVGTAPAPYGMWNRIEFKFHFHLFGRKCIHARVRPRGTEKKICVQTVIYACMQIWHRMKSTLCWPLLDARAVHFENYAKRNVAGVLLVGDALVRAGAYFALVHCWAMVTMATWTCLTVLTASECTCGLQFGRVDVRAVGDKRFWCSITNISIQHAPIS